jgi:hypothetical protein
MLSTPVALIIFNRPETTERVFAQIARAKPKTLFVVADGPRPDRPGEAEKCSATRSIIERVNWDCEVVKNYSDINLGCGIRPATGITWVFEQVKRAIILEDDCIPHGSFFRFCDELLERYSEDERVMQICGTNPHASYRSEYSYFFSRMIECWGWATWARAWQHYDFKMSHWPEIRETSLFLNVAPNSVFAAQQKQLFQATYEQVLQENCTAWDYQWSLTVWSRDGLTIMPSVNLVSNVGFGSGATHTKSRSGSFYQQYGELGTEEMHFPLRHPPCMIREYEYDRLAVECQASLKRPSNFYRKVRSKVARVRCLVSSLVPAIGGPKDA